MANKNSANKPTNFQIYNKAKLKDFYADETSRRNRNNQAGSTGGFSAYTTPATVRTALLQAFADKSTILDLSSKLYAINPIFANIINYYSNMFTWQYKVIPHKIYTKSKAKARKQINAEDYGQMYRQMLEVVDGLNIETKFPELLKRLFISGAVYITTDLDEDSCTINSIILPARYCRTIGQTQYGTYIIQFNCAYFSDLGYTSEQLQTFLKTWPKELTKAYNAYKKDTVNKQWYTLDPTHSTAILLNEQGIPTLFYLYGSILNYEKYQDNELERSNNLLRYLVVHTIPHYEDQLLFEVDEVRDLHKSLKKIIENGDKARLITTYGDAHVEKISDNDESIGDALENAYDAIFNNMGLNHALFNDKSVTALTMSVARDKQLVWKYVEGLKNFYNLSINNYLDFKGYEANVDILPISPYTYDNDVKRYKDNATLGVGKLDYLIAAGIKQRHVQDNFELEQFLDFSQLTPLQTSYTQTAEDRKTEDEPSDNKPSTDSKPGIEPSDNEDSEDLENSDSEN